MKRLSLLTLTIMITLACQRSEANPLDAAISNGMGDSASLTRRTACYDADEWTCAVEAAIVRKTNEKRAGTAGPLEQYFESSHVARDHSTYMAEQNDISHDNFQSRGDALARELPGLVINYLGENVAMMSYQSQLDPESVAAEFVKMWWNSDGHRENMLGGKYRSIGVGVVRTENEIYATQVFH
jgi:uncharacterized protein YkwD